MANAEDEHKYPHVFSRFSILSNHEYKYPNATVLCNGNENVKIRLKE